MLVDRFRSKEACASIKHEFAMFDVLGQRLEDLPGTPGWDAVDHALLESFLLHTRVLRDFFFHEGHRSEDLVAAQFIPNWKLIRPATAKYLFTHKKRLDQSLGRLTVKRAQSAKEGWDIRAIRSEIEPLIRLFHVNLPPNLKELFGQQTEESGTAGQGTDSGRLS